MRKSVMSAWVILASVSSVWAAPLKMNVKLGTLEFAAPANIGTFNVNGVAEKIDGTAVIDGQTLKSVEIHIPVESLTTHMSMRDKHMRERVFQTKDGKTLALVLTADTTACTGKPEALFCPLQAQLEIQGVKKPFKSDISLVTDGKTRKVKAQGTVKLSDYGIEQPQQLGVKVSNEVAIKADLVLE